MDATRVAALAKVVIGACEELVREMKRAPLPAPAADRPVQVTGWPTPNRIEFLRQWYPTYAASSLIFRAIRAMDGPAPGNDAVMTTYAVTRLKLKRPTDVRSNHAAVARASRELCEAVGFALPEAAAPVPAPVATAPARLAVRPSAPTAAAGPGAAIWHPWATIKVLARREGVILDGLGDLPGYNKRREARGLAPLYLKTFKMGQS